MTATLTQRYIAATVHSLPPSSQDDVRAELSASSRTPSRPRSENGGAAEAAERSALNELGDPALLAAGFADRPLHLIGPRYYPTWWRLLVLLAIVPACVLGAVASASRSPGRGRARSSGSRSRRPCRPPCISLLGLVFVILERRRRAAGLDGRQSARGARERLRPGQPDRLAGVPRPGRRGADLGPVRRVRPDRRRDRPRAQPVPVALVDEAGLLALLAAEAAFAVVLFARRRWSAALAVANTAIAVLFASLALTLLGRGQLVNPEFVVLIVERTGSPDLPRILGVLVAFSVAAIGVWDVVDGWLKARRAAPS